MAYFKRNSKVTLKHSPLLGEKIDSNFENIYIAKSLISRLIGLLGSKEMEKDSGLLIEKCNQIHTVGMKYKIDVVYLSRSGQVRKIIPGMPPNRFSSCIQANRVIEFAEGFVKKNNIKVDDFIGMEK